KKYPQFEKIILMASRLTKEKNIPLAIEAMKEVVKKYPKAGLLIVGDGPEKEKLKAKRSTLNANIIFEDWTDDLASYYKTSDIFLLTSDYEGYGRTIIEALVAGTPVVSTDVGYAREAGVVLTEHNASSISEKIVDFFKDQKKRSFEYEYKSKDEYLDKFRSQFSLGD
ncbi:glycosyltransferase family 4 protein, partial [Candidatus Azambacteria bacterium]|nr:glycosyltransferase family 4 protein [Candidatus Azambacteria bacterium]